MQLAAHAYAIPLSVGGILSLSSPLDAAMFFALQWMAACLLCALISWTLIVFVFQRRNHLRATHRGTLSMALLLLTFAAGTLVIEGRVFAMPAPLFCAPVQILFLLYFSLFSNERYTSRRTRWLGIITMFALLAPFWPQQPKSSPSAASFPFFQVPGLLGVLMTLSNTFAILPVIVGIVPQLYYRYRYFALTGEQRPPKPRRELLLCGALSIGCFLMFLALGGLSQAAQGLAPGALFAETGFALLLALLPAAASFTVLHRRRFDRAAFLNRLLVSGLLTLCLLLIYAGSILALWATFPGFAGLASFVYIPFLISIALLMALAFRPLQAQIQKRVNRRFSPRTYAAAQQITAFTAVLRADTPLDELSTRLIAVIQQSLLPASVLLWLQTSSAPMTLRVPGNRSMASSYEPTQEQPAPAELRLHRQAEATPDQSAPAALTVALDDPALPSLLRPASVMEIDRQPSSSAVMGLLRAAQMALAVSFVSQGELVGLLALGPQLSDVPVRRYTFDDCDLLAQLSEQIAPRLSQMQRAHAQELEERAHERVEQELQTARRIQEALLPKGVPLLDGWQMETCYQPAREVGGDFYDFLALADGRLGIVLGDVTDKGIPAALVMATTRSMLRAVAAQPATSPGQVLAQVNELLCLDLPANMFVTCFYAVLDPVTGRLLYANAGQDLPYLRHADGPVDELRARGMPLGLMPGMQYEEEETTLLPGDCLLFYSDGLVEAHNPRREMFGFPRLMALLGQPAEESSLIQFLRHELATFTGPDWKQEDDLTLVVLQRAADASRDEVPVLSDEMQHTAELLMVLKSSTAHREE